MIPQSGLPIQQQLLFLTVIGADGKEELQIQELTSHKSNGVSFKYREPIEGPYCRTIQNVQNYHECK